MHTAPNRFRTQEGGYHPPVSAGLRMSYIELLNRFDTLDAEQAFSASATRLYVKILAECNRQRWQNPFTLTDRKLTTLMGGSVNTMKKARTELEERGLLAYQAGGNGAGDGCVYALQTGPTDAPNKVSISDTFRPNKVSGMVSKTDTLKANKVSEKVSISDTILYKEEDKTSSVVEDKDQCAGAAGFKKIEGSSAASSLPSDSPVLTSANSGGGAPAEARTLALAIAQNWQVSEQKNFRRFAQVHRFCKLLAEAGKLEELRTQFHAYTAFRALKGIGAHSLDNYLGHETNLSPDGMPYADGAWCDCDWPAKLQEAQSTRKPEARPAFGPAPTSTAVAGNLLAKNSQKVR
ncbi:hypothetical protein [Hymenobacter fodinae]|uniref:Helix-turn-helix protein n=1 Tax=Hymenobacter fodinae TaxID=2510796 RepID=A0A4Z0P614_9BACT|nr:hypothetical protein [Hymenobacter fodinae]TGE07731.1 hypothetical protein EU556_08230 [Hymenobacter fodinae]